MNCRTSLLSNLSMFGHGVDNTLTRMPRVLGRPCGRCSSLKNGDRHSAQCVISTACHFSYGTHNCTPRSSSSSSSSHSERVGIFPYSDAIFGALSDDAIHARTHKHVHAFRVHTDNKEMQSMHARERTQPSKVAGFACVPRAFSFCFCGALVQVCVCVCMCWRVHYAIVADCCCWWWEGGDGSGSLP